MLTVNSKMAEQFQFELVVPENLLISKQVDSVVVPGTEGEFQAMDSHAAFMSTIRPGVISVQTGNEQEQFFVRGGFADVEQNGLTILAEMAVRVEDLKGDEISQQIKNAEEDLADSKDEVTRRKTETLLNQLKEIQAVLDI